MTEPASVRPSPAPDAPWSESTDAPAPITRASSGRISRPLPPHEDTTPVRGVVVPDAATRPIAWAEAFDRMVDTLSRRGLRVLIGYWTFRLQSAGKLDATSAAVLIVCAVGVEAAIRAWRERKPATAAAVMLPVVLAGLGELARLAPLTHAAGYLTASMLFVAGIARRLP